MANAFVHLELCTSDLAKSKDFYGSLFDWSFTDTDMGEGMVYSMFNPGSGPAGGIYSMPGAPPAWLAYVGVNDIHAATQKATSLGATLVRGPMPVPGHGWMSILTDPTGAAVALWQGETTA